MIVKMKKVALITTTGDKEACLTKLRELGVMHIESTVKESDSLTELKEERQRIVNALQLLGQLKVDKLATVAKGLTEKEGSAAVDEVLALEEAKSAIVEEIHNLKKEIDRVRPWGNLNPEDFRYLQERGMSLHLYDLPDDALEKWDESCTYIKLENGKKRSKILFICEPGGTCPEGEFPLPVASFQDLEIQLEKWETELSQEEERLAQYCHTVPAIKSELQRMDKALEFEEVKLSMESDTELNILSGYVPIDKCGDVKQEAANQGWGLVIEDPAPEDPVPTLTRNPKWIRIVQPVFDMLGTIPGYSEYDISFWFLLFFSFFFAMIIGDAGYGAIMLVLTIIARKKVKNAPGSIFALLYVMCTATIIWGALSGTWFGSESLAANTPLSYLVIPYISSVPQLSDGIDTTYFIMNFCFLLGAVHLSIARLTNFIKRFPHLSSYAEIGWLVLLWGLYFLVRNIVLQQELYYLAPWLIGIGFGMVVLFAEQNGNFFKGIGVGLAKSLLKALDAIGGFSDIISYVRLYAVGLATVEVARAWNIMAEGIGFNNIIAGLIAGLILFAGHALNIVMGIMSIVVHGVRLNMLEFSGHLGMEWSGREYNPFRE